MHQRKAEDASSAQELLQQAVEEMDSLVNAAESFSAEPIDSAIAELESLVSDIDALPQQHANAENTAISASDSNETIAGDSLTATDIHGVDAYKNTAGYGPWLKKENDETVKHDENLASSDGLVLDERTARAIRLAAETDEEKYQELRDYANDKANDRVIEEAFKALDEADPDSDVTNIEDAFKMLSEKGFGNLVKKLKDFDAFTASSWNKPGSIVDRNTSLALLYNSILRRVKGNTFRNYSEYLSDAANKSKDSVWKKKLDQRIRSIVKINQPQLKNKLNEERDWLEDLVASKESLLGRELTDEELEDIVTSKESLWIQKNKLNEELEDIVKINLPILKKDIGEERKDSERQNRENALSETPRKLTDQERTRELELNQYNSLKNAYNYIDLVIKNIQRIPVAQRTPAQKELIDKFKSPEAVRLFDKILATPEDKTSDSAYQEIIPEDKYAELAHNVNRVRYISEWKMSPEQLKEKEQYIAQWTKLVSQGRIKQPEKLLAENLYVPDEAAADDDGNNVAKTWLRKVDVSRVIDSSPAMQNIVSDSIAELTNYLRKNYIHQSKSAASASLKRTLSADDKQTPESYSIEIEKYLKKAVREFIDAKTNELGRAIFFQEYLQLVRAAFAGTTNVKDFIETLVGASGGVTLDDRLKKLLEDEEFIANIEKMIVSEIGTGAFDKNSGPLAGFSIKTYPANASVGGSIWHESVDNLEAIPVYKTESGVDVVSPEGNDDVAQYYKNVEYAKERIEDARDNALAPLKTFTDAVARWNTKFKGLDKELTDAGTILKNFAGDKALRLAFFSPGIHRPLVDAARAELENAIKLLKQGYRVTTALTEAIKESSKSVPSLQELVAGSMLSESDKFGNIEYIISYIARDQETGKSEIPRPYDEKAEEKTFDVSKESNIALSEYVNDKVSLLNASFKKLSAEVNNWLSANEKEIQNRATELRGIIDNIHTSTASIESVYKKITQSAPVTDMVLRARSAASGLLYKIMQKNRQPGAASVMASIQDTKDALRHYISSKERERKQKEKLYTQQKDSYAEYSEALSAATKMLDEYNKRNDTLQQDELAQFIEETKDTYQDPAVAKNEFYKKKYDEYASLTEDAEAAQKNLDYVQNKMQYLDNSIVLLLSNSSDAKTALATFTEKTSKYVAIYNQLVEIFGGEQFSIPQEKLLKASPEYAEAAEVLYQLERAHIAIKTDEENYEDDAAALKQLAEKKEQLLAHIQAFKPIYIDLQESARNQVIGGQENFEQSEELLAELRKEDTVVDAAIKAAIAVIESPSNKFIPTPEEEASAEAAKRSEDDKADAAREEAGIRTEDDNSETDGSIESSASATHKSRCHMRSAKDNIWLSVNASLPITPTLKEIQKLIELAKDMVFPSIDGHAIAMVLSNHGAFQQDTGLTSFLVNDTLSALDNAGITVTNRNVLEQALWYGEGAND